MHFLLAGLFWLLSTSLVVATVNYLPLMGVSGGGGSISSYSGPGDIVAAAAWFGLRPYSLATAGNKAVNVIRASDSHTCDFVTSTTTGLGASANCSTGGDNGSTLSSWLAATTGTVITIYDQTGSTNCSGAACDLTQATSSRRPSITLNCLGSLPCLTFSRAANQNLGESSSLNTGVANGPAFTAAANRTGTTTSFHEFFGAGHSELIFQNAVNSAGIYGGTGVYQAANDNTWHAMQGFATTTASTTYTYIDGSNTTGTDSNNLTLTGVFLGCFNNSASTDCLDGTLAEAGIFDAQGATGWAALQKSNMNTNIHNFWGF